MNEYGEIDPEYVLTSLPPPIFYQSPILKTRQVRSIGRGQESIQWKIEVRKCMQKARPNVFQGRAG